MKKENFLKDNRGTSKLLILLCVILAGIMVYCLIVQPLMAKKDAQKQENDREKIEKVIAAAIKACNTSAVKALNPSSTGYTVISINTVYRYEKGENKFCDAMRKELGEDFDGTLSNGDSIGIALLRNPNKFFVYAGTFVPGSDSESLLYPNWNYKKVEKE